MKKKTRADYYKENPESYAKKKKYDSKLGKRDDLKKKRVELKKEYFKAPPKSAKGKKGSAKAMVTKRGKTQEEPQFDLCLGAAGQRNGKNKAVLKSLSNEIRQKLAVRSINR